MVEFISEDVMEELQMELKKIAVISDEFKEFIQSGNYEVSILKLMNQSRIVFPNTYIRNEIQSSSECDFVDTITAEKYEAKLPFDKREGILICSNKGNLKDWLVYMMDEEAEFGELIIEKRGQHSVTELKLYKTLVKRLKTVQESENAIFFFPYPITLDMDPYDSFSMLQFCSDILDSVFRELKKNGLVGNRKVYAIYPSLDEKMVLRCLNDNKREYLSSIDAEKYFKYSFSG